MKILKVIETDVAIVGGGTAGCMAAISAADAGVKTIIIEKNSVLGGTMTSAEVAFPGIFTVGHKQIISGHCWEMIKELEKTGDALMPEKDVTEHPYWLCQIRLNSFAVECVLAKMCKKYGVDIHLHTMLADAEVTDEGVTLTVAAKEGLFVVKAKVVIDCTGDADLVRMLGFACQKSEVLQPASLTVRFEGYNKDDINQEELLSVAEKYLKAGRLSNLVTPKKVVRWMLEGETTQQHIFCDRDIDTSKGKTELELQSREILFDILSCIKSVKGGENARIVNPGIECGVRESNRVVGEHIITAEEYLSGKVYSDAISYAWYPIDLHMAMDLDIRHLESGVIPTIPYRSLIPKGSARVLVAGRIVSSDSLANSGLRVQAPCFAMGQAAGCAAAIAVKDNVDVRQVDYNKLSNELTRQGAIVPN